MKNFKSAQTAVSILTVATVIGLCAAPAQAAPITISVSGVFDTVPTVPANQYVSGNAASGLLGTAYSASYTVSTNPADATVHERVGVSEFDGLGVPVDAHGWSFFHPSACQGSAICSMFPTTYAYGPANNTLTTTQGSFSDGQVTIISAVNNFNYNSSQSVLPAGILPAGVYDVLSFGGLWKNFSSCSGRVEIEEIGCNNYAPGLNIFTDFLLIGTRDMFQDSVTYPLDGSMDLSQVRYGMFFLEAKFNGEWTGQANQDPPLTLVNGVLVGDNMSVTAVVLSVPEPATFALLPMGLGLMGFAARRRQRSPSAMSAALG